MKKKSAALILVAIVLTLGFAQQFFSTADLPDNLHDMSWSPYPPDVEENKELQDGECACFEGVGAGKGDAPQIVWNNGERELVVCGFVDSRANENEAIMTEFSVFDGATGKIVFWSDSLTYYRVTRDAQGITLRRLATLPVIENGWEEIVVSETRILLVDKDWQIGEEIPINHAIHASEERIAALKRSVDSHGSVELQELMQECLACSLAGSPYAQQLLVDFQQRLSINLSGSDAQVYANCLALYNFYRGASAAA